MLLQNHFQQGLSLLRTHRAKDALEIRLLRLNGYDIRLGLRDAVSFRVTMNNDTSDSDFTIPSGSLSEW